MASSPLLVRAMWLGLCMTWGFCSRVPGNFTSVIGHKAPDTDAVTSAMVYAWELNARALSANTFVLGELNPETEYVMKFCGVAAPPLLPKIEYKSEVAIVDTNNPEELPDDIDQALIHSVIDHHPKKDNSIVAGLTTGQVDMRMIASATSIVYARIKARSLVPPVHIAKLMLAGILSDSLHFRSPTTTELDKQHAKELAQYARMTDDEVTEFANAMFEAKANVSHVSAADLLTMDSKIFKMGGQKLRVSVLETTKPAIPLSKRSDLCEAMKLKKTDEALDEILLFVVDILNEVAIALACTDTQKQIVMRAWPEKATIDAVELEGTRQLRLPGVVSRKKQMIPALEAVYNKKDEM